MILLLALIPTVIVICTFIFYFGTKRGFDSFLHDIGEKTKEIIRISNLTFMKELLTFFFNSNASETAKFMIGNAQSGGSIREESLSDAAEFVGREVENLHSELSKSYVPRIEFEKIKFETTILRRMILIYGLLIGSLEYILILYSVIAGGSSLFNLYDGILLGGTVIIAGAMTLIVADIVRLSHRLDEIVDDLTFSQLGKGKGNPAD